MSQPFFVPPAASTLAPQTDALFFALLWISGAIILLVLTFIVVFSVRYRRGSAARRGPLPQFVQREFEIGWTTATLFMFLFLFWWANTSQLAALIPPHEAMEIHVVAKQWMWKAQHANGVREISAIHVPIGQAVRLVMTSEDVIHSFFVPAFRIKQDILPGRTVESWFQATRPGTYRLMCTQYCGAEHSAMVGSIVVMTQADFQHWLADQPEADSLAGEGRGLFVSLGCAGCHTPGSPVHAPDLAGVFGRAAQLADGREATVDEAYVRDQILEPNTLRVAGYDPIMPSFKGAIDDGQILALTAYIRALGAQTGGRP